MQFLVVSRRKTEAFSDAEFAPMLEAEAQAARQLYLDGFIRQIWHRGDMPGAVLLLEAKDIDEARQTLGTLPMVKAGMLETVTLMPLTPYRGFGPR